MEFFGYDPDGDIPVETITRLYLASRRAIARNLQVIGAPERSECERRRVQATRVRAGHEQAFEPVGL